jgi:hypothetical protein
VIWPQLSEELNEKMGRARALLGSSNDLMVLKGYTRANQPLALWRSKLKCPIDRRRKFLLKQANRELESIFQIAPRVFRSRLVLSAKRANE